MGAISGLIMLGIAFWFHQTTISENESKAEDQKQNAWQAFWIGAGSYFGGYLLGLFLNRAIIFFFPIDVGVGGSFGEASGGDTGIVGIFYEFLPLIAGIVLAYFVRLKFILKKI